MGEKWQEIRIMYTHEEKKTSTPLDLQEKKYNNQTNINKAIDSMRVFKDGMKEVTIKEFFQEFINKEMDEVLSIGTRGVYRVR